MRTVKVRILPPQPTSPSVESRDLRRCVECPTWARDLSRAGTGTCLSYISLWCGAFLEPVTIPDRAFPAVVGHLKVLCQFQCVGWTGVFTQTAKHAARSVIGERGQNLSPRRVVSLPAHHNQVLRAGQRAQVARDAQRFPGLRIFVQPRRSAKAFG